MNTLALSFTMLLTLAVSSVAHAQDPECFVAGSNFDVCDFAKRFQEETAPELPMAVSGDMTMDSVIALGPEVTFGVRWPSGWEQLQARMVLNDKTLEDVSKQLQVNAENAVCSAKTLRAFVTLGGKVAYAYRTSDGHMIYTARVENCEAP